MCSREECSVRVRDGCVDEVCRKGWCEGEGREVKGRGGADGREGGKEGRKEGGSGGEGRGGDEAWKF